MDIKASKPLFNSVQSTLLINPIQRNHVLYRIPLGLKPDSLATSSDLDKYFTESAIVDMVKANPTVVKLLKENKMPVKVNKKIITELRAEHLPQTRATAVGIIANLPEEFRGAVDFEAVQQGAMLHDIGKTLIPHKIVGKTGKLSEKELAKMQMHPLLGYELLKTTDLGDTTLNLVRNHHQNPMKTGYPHLPETYVYDLNSQILSTADIYSALRAKRSYKPEFSKNQALVILHQKMKDGEIHPYVFKALVDYANKEEAALAQVNSNGKVLYAESENRLSA